MIESKSINSNSAKETSRNVKPGLGVSQKSCSICGEKGKMLSASAAADLLGVTVFSIYRRAETGEIHFTVDADGSLLLCRKTLLEQYGQ